MMSIGRKYSLLEYGKKVSQLIKQKIGSKRFPTDDEIIKYWEAVSNPLLPLTYMYIISTLDNSVFRAKGMSLLGWHDDSVFQHGEMRKMFHENQSLLLAHQILAVTEILIEYPGLVKNKGVAYCTTRGIKSSLDENDKHWLVHQIGIPIQFDENNITTKYFCTNRILGEYNGEPLKTEIYADKQFLKEQEELRKLLADKKSTLLGVLGFSRVERQIIDYIAITGLNTKQIAEQLEVAEKTIRNHRGNINKKAKEIFPLNTFENTEDVVKYLQQQLII